MGLRLDLGCSRLEFLVSRHFATHSTGFEARSVAQVRAEGTPLARSSDATVGGEKI